MKAAVLHEVGGIPRYEDFPAPEPGAGEVLVKVSAVAVENVDREIAAGRHFSAKEFLARLPAIPCFDGVGTLPDGRLVGFGGVTPPYGALAEYTVVPESHLTPAPHELEPAVAVALSSAVTGFAITTAAGFVAGETVLIQGATGVAGRLAVQVARKLGAGRIVATGRDDASLADVAALGADAVITTAVADEELVAAYTEHAGDGYDVVLDFLWGRPTGLLTRALVPDRIALTKPTRLVQVGASAGPTIALDAESVRTSGLEIYGATKGIDGETMGRAYAQVVQWARDRELDFNLVTMPLSQIEAAWQRTDLRGKRLVIVP